MLRKLIAAALLVGVCGTAAGVAYASNGHGELARVKRANDKYRNVTVAEGAEYGKLLDKDGIACIDMPGMGAMGVHYAKGAIVGDGAIDPQTPEAVIYEPQENGRLKLVAIEYVVFKADWDANHPAPPRLFGQEFNFTPAGNRFGLPDYYSLHVWLWKHNPAGTFAPWNPDVSCTPGDDGHHGHHDDDPDGQNDMQNM
jgi:hypothetical protein